MIANTNTSGVYILDALATKVSVFAFLSVAVSVYASILDTVLDSYVLVTFNSIKPLLFIIPDNA